MHNREARTAVDNGVRLLNRVRPGWHNDIDLNDLNMASSSNCILGQLFGDYTDGLMNLFGTASVDASRRNGFTNTNNCDLRIGFEDLDHEWKRAICLLRDPLDDWERELLSGGFSEADVNEAYANGNEVGRAEGMNAYRQALVKVDEAQKDAGLNLNIAQVMALVAGLNNVGVVTLAP